MDDYISRADVLKERQTFAVLGIPDLVDAVLIEDIEAIHAADVRPVARGEWITPPKNRDYSHLVDFYECPFCGYVEDCLVNFCPNCGADMREAQTMTNAEKIRQMTDEELATKLCVSICNMIPWPICNQHTDTAECDKCILDWLKQEVEE